MSPARQEHLVPPPRLTPRLQIVLALAVSVTGCTAPAAGHGDEALEDGKTDAPSSAGDEDLRPASELDPDLFAPWGEEVVSVGVPPGVAAARNLESRLTFFVTIESISDHLQNFRAQGLEAPLVPGLNKDEP